jgi:hypothetical protein
MPSVVLVSKSGSEFPVSKPSAFVDAVYGRGAHPKTGTVAANWATLTAGGPDPVESANEHVTLGDLTSSGPARDALRAASVAAVDASASAARRAASNADHAAAYSRIQRLFLGPAAGVFVARTGNDYTLLHGLGGGRYAAFLLPFASQSWNGVTYSLNQLQGCAIQIPMLSVDDTQATFTGAWTTSFAAVNVGYAPKPLTVSMNSGSTTVTVTSGTIDVADVGRRATIPGAGVGGADLITTISVRNSSTSFGVGTAASTTVAGAAATIWPTFRYSIDPATNVSWASPAISTALAVGIVKAQNGGLGKVTIGGDATAANLLPTAQQLVTTGTYPNTILVANGGTLNPTDRVLDCYSGSITTTYDVKVAIAEGLTAGTHTVVLTPTGYTANGGTGARLYIDRFASATAATTPTTSGAAMFTAYDLSAGNSAWEYAVDCVPTAGGTHQFIGGTVHGYEHQQTLAVKINDAAATPADGSLTSCNSVEIVRTTKLFHPDIGAALNASPIATSTVTYRLDRLGLIVSPDIVFNVATTVLVGYSMMPLVGALGTTVKMDRVSLEAFPAVLSLPGSSDTRYGHSRSACAWAWNSTGKLGALAYVPDHYGFTDGYAASAGLTSVQDRNGTVTKFYFPWSGPESGDTDLQVPAGYRKTWTTRYLFGYFADANATLAAA